MVLPDEIRNAAIGNDQAAIQKWLSTGKFTRDDLDEKLLCGGSDGMTLLMLVSANGHCDVMRELLTHGASLEASGECGTALHHAAYTGQIEAAALLLDHGAQIEARSFYNGESEEDEYDEEKESPCGTTPLMEAAEGAECDMLRFLLSRGACLDEQNNAGRDAEAVARYTESRRCDVAADLLAEIKRAGGWKPFVCFPRKCLFALQRLCSEGRATTGDRLLEFVFGTNSSHPVPKGVDPAIFEKLTAGARAQIRAVSRVVYPSSRHKKPRGPARAQLPKEIFWHILKFWRCDRDSRH